MNETETSKLQKVIATPTYIYVCAEIGDTGTVDATLIII
jgi:predicted nucleic acid-binding Zn ribbon protein